MKTKDLQASPELQSFRELAKQMWAAYKVRGKIRPHAAGEAEAQALLDRLTEEIRCVEDSLFSKPVGSLDAVVERFEVLRFWLLPSDDKSAIPDELESEDGVLRSAAHLYVALAALFESDRRPSHGGGDK